MRCTAASTQHPAPRTMDINEFELENTQKWFQHTAADTRTLDRYLVTRWGEGGLFRGEDDEWCINFSLLTTIISYNSKEPAHFRIRTARHWSCKRTSAKFKVTQVGFSPG